MQNVGESYVDDGTHLNTSELRQNSFTDSEKPEGGIKPSAGNEYTVEKKTQRAIYDLLLGILKEFHLSTKDSANRAMEKLAKKSAKPSDLGDGLNETVTM